MSPHVEPSMWVFIIVYGLDWVATVPPTVAMCREWFGAATGPIVFGWVFASHQVGAASPPPAPASSATSPAATTRRSTPRPGSARSPR